MSEQLAPVLFWLIVIIPFAVFARQIQQVRRGMRRKSKGAVVFFSYSILPVLIYGLVFLVLVGVEEHTRLSVVTEEFARTFPFVVGIGSAEVLFLTAIFAVSVWFLRIPANAD